MPRRFSHKLAKDILIWTGAFRFYSEKARTGDVFALLILIDHLNRGLNTNTLLVEDGKIAVGDFERLLKGLIWDYNPASDIQRLSESMLYIELSTESHLRTRFGDKICGKFLRVSNDPITILLLNEQTGLYENEVVDIILEIAYPTAQDCLKLSILDIEEVEYFN